jgi:hypothetical protein
MMFRIFQCRIHLSCELVEALTALYRGRVPKLGDPEGRPSRDVFAQAFFSVMRPADASFVHEHAGRLATISVAGAIETATSGEARPPPMTSARSPCGHGARVDVVG